jgi:hypothetical protein
MRSLLDLMLIGFFKGSIRSKSRAAICPIALIVSLLSARKDRIPGPYISNNSGNDKTKSTSYSAQIQAPHVQKGSESLPKMTPKVGIFDSMFKPLYNICARVFRFPQKQQIRDEQYAKEAGENLSKVIDSHYSTKASNTEPDSEIRLFLGNAQEELRPSILGHAINKLSKVRTTINNESSPEYKASQALLDYAVNNKIPVPFDSLKAAYWSTSEPDLRETMDTLRHKHHPDPTDSKYVRSWYE